MKNREIDELKQELSEARSASLKEWKKMYEEHVKEDKPGGWKQNG